MNENYSRSAVIKIISQVQDRLSNLNPCGDDEALKEIKTIMMDVKSILQDAQKEIFENSPSFPKSNDELMVATQETERAANKILENSADIQELLAQGEQTETTKKIQDKISEIVVACSFQDITGQRISKACKYIKKIEESVEKLSHILDANLAEDDDFESDSSKTLMNGPQMPGKALTQADIDKLLDDMFD